MPPLRIGGIAASKVRGVGGKAKLFRSARRKHDPPSPPPTTGHRPLIPYCLFPISDLLFSCLEPITPEKPTRTRPYEAIHSRSLVYAFCITLVRLRPNHTARRPLAL